MIRDPTGAGKRCVRQIDTGERGANGGVSVQSRVQGKREYSTQFIEDSEPNGGGT